MSYGDEPQSLDFSGMHVACLSGDNGNGKSALLDAISYSLWGKTRATGSQAAGEDDLVRLGSEEMEVRFEFLLGGDRYRVVRRRNKRSRSGDWQVHLASNGAQPELSETENRKSDSWIPVGGSSIRETERHLARILRMEYETFLNSAYFQQGRADEFTRQKPDARKRILADILDLSRYDRLEEMARERRTECDLAAKDLEGEIRHLEARAAEEAAHRESLALHEESLSKWSAERALREAKLAAIRSELAALTEKEVRLREREERLNEVRREVEEMVGQIARLTERADQEKALLEKAESIETDFARLNEARSLVEQLDKDVQEAFEAREALAAANGRLDLCRRDLQNQISLAESECAAAQERAAQIDRIERKIAESEPKIAELKKAEEELTAIQKELGEAAQEFADLSSQNKRYRAEIDETERALALLGAAKSACPVCETGLSGDRLQSVTLKLKGKKAGFEASLKDTNREGSAVKARRDELQARIDSITQRIAGAAAIRGQVTEMERSRNDLLRQNAGSENSFEKRETLRRELDSEAFGLEVRRDIQALHDRLGLLKTASERHTAARNLAKELSARGVESLHARLKEAERNHAHLQNELEELNKKSEKRRLQIEAEESRLEGLRAELCAIEKVRESASSMEAEYAGAIKECDEARALVERTLQILDGCVKARELAEQKSAERAKILVDRQAYTDLAAAFGRKGVQAHIIHNALPEIQDEANRLLARMTDNQMQIVLDTQRSARSGSGQIETLDITITDDSGTRPYEMYSGGESFRVNFAIRIALSRLLARRAGARLQTLIIDEGFGTQDAKGRERLVEAIEMIRDEFALVLIITHLEDLKDAFPTRIEIVKTPAGSRICYVD